MASFGLRTTLVAVLLAAISVCAATAAPAAGRGTDPARSALVAGGYRAVLSSAYGTHSLTLRDLVWDDPDAPGVQVVSTSGRDDSHLGRFAVDRWGRVAWAQSFKPDGTTWTSVRARTQAGTLVTLGRIHAGLRAVKTLRFAGDSVRWTARGRTHQKRVERPQCQLPTDAQVLASSPAAIVARGGGDRSGVVGCLRADGRWRFLAGEVQSSHGSGVTRAATAGAMVGLSLISWGGNEDCWIVTADLRRGRSIGPTRSGCAAYIDAITPDGRYVWERTFFRPRPDGGGTDDGARLIASGPGHPDTQLDEAVRGSFTEVSIINDTVSWKTAGQPKTATLPKGL